MARDALGLRSDGFLDEVGLVGGWLTDRGVSDTERVERYELWRDALVSADFARVRSQLQLRQAWWDRLSKADSAQRLRLAASLPAPLLVMSFLREGGTPQVDEDWQEVSHASPGQRSAAMLSFILHHGNEPLVLDQPEDDLDSAWVSSLIIKELRRSRWTRQLIVVTHNANIPVLGDCERVIVMENVGGKVRATEAGPIENVAVRQRIQDVMEGGVEAFVRRERRYDNELSQYRRAMRGMQEKFGQAVT
jgi:ATPase subunit of ABC transporter with duplicated ATPase domains